MGGMLSQQQMYKHRFMDLDIQKDILQETFVNTMSAWINLLLLSASGQVSETSDGGLQDNNVLAMTSL